MRNTGIDKETFCCLAEETQGAIDEATVALASEGVVEFVIPASVTDALRS